MKELGQGMKCTATDSCAENTDLENTKLDSLVLRVKMGLESFAAFFLFLFLKKSTWFITAFMRQRIW